MLTSKLDKIVIEHYAKKQALKPIESKNNSVIFTDSLKRINGFCKTEYKSFFTIPLIFYYYSKEKIFCRINPKFYANTILAEFNDRLKDESKSKKLDGKTIEIIFNTIPTSFYHQYTNHFVLVQYANLSFSKDELYNERDDLKISYIIRDNQTSQIIKRGRVENQFLSNSYRKAFRERRKTFIRNFVATFDNNLQFSCRQIAQYLINELD